MEEIVQCKKDKIKDASLLEFICTSLKENGFLPIYQEAIAAGFGPNEFCNATCNQKRYTFPYDRKLVSEIISSNRLLEIYNSLSNEYNSKWAIKGERERIKSVTFEGYPNEINYALVAIENYSNSELEELNEAGLSMSGSIISGTSQDGLNLTLRRYFERKSNYYLDRGDIQDISRVISACINLSDIENLFKEKYKTMNTLKEILDQRAKSVGKTVVLKIIQPSLKVEATFVDK